MGSDFGIGDSFLLGSKSGNPHGTDAGLLIDTALAAVRHALAATAGSEPNAILLSEAVQLGQGPKEL